jgi:hypothetical protein
MAFLFEYSDFPRRPSRGEPGPFPRFHARLTEAEALLAWGVAGERGPADGGPAATDGREDPGEPGASGGPGARG